MRKPIFSVGMGMKPRSLSDVPSLETPQVLWWQEGHFMVAQFVPLVLAAVAGWVLLTGCATMDGQGSVLQAGVATVDITPPKGYRMAGYFRERFNTGTHDPLLAKAVVLRQDDERIALVICDVLYVSREVSDRARVLAGCKTDIPVANIAIAATHAHTGPMYYGPLRDYFHERAVAEHGHDPHELTDYWTELSDKIAGVIVQASASVQPVTLEAGIASETRLSFNRRFHMKDGPVRFNPGQKNPNIVRVAGPIDPDVGLLLLRDRESKPIASLTAFALHLDTTGGTEYSADYPYYLQRRLSDALDTSMVSMFGIGTCGDINHIDVGIKGRRSAEEIGTLLAETVLAEVPELDRIDEPSLAVRSETISVPMQQYSPEEVAQAKRDLPKVGTRALSFLEQVKAYKIMAIEKRGSNTLPIEVQVFRLSSDVAIVLIPGEVFVDIGLAIKKASPFKTTLVIQLANDGPGYIPTRKAFAEGSYETVNSRIQPGGGEAMTELAVRLLNELAH